MVTVPTSQLYQYNGSLANLLGLDVAPSFTRVNGVINDDDAMMGQGSPTTVSIDGGAEEVMNYQQSGTVSAVLGLLGTRDIAIFTVPSEPGVTYVYAPDGLPTLLGATVLYDYDLTSAPFALPTTTPGIVDGTDGADLMPVGYIDLDGDQITNSVIFVSDGDDVIDGKGGNDTINAGSGDDSVLGGSGNDSILGGSGNDTIDGGVDNDTLIGGTGNDRIQGGLGNDSIEGGSGNDSLQGGDGDDTLLGGSGVDTIYGDAGNDSISGGDGNDLIYGGAGNDTIQGGLGADTVYAGDGNDVWLDDDTAGSGGSDTVYLEGGDDYAELGFATSGTPEIIDGGAGTDTFALDSAAVNAANIGLTLNETGPATNIGFGTTTSIRNFENVRGNAGTNALTGNSGDNQLWGLAGSDTLNGGGGNDTLDGGADNDTINGGDGDDRIIGGLGNDVLTGGNGSDTFVYTAGDGLDTIADFNTGDTSGAIGDSDNTNNDYLELSGFYDSLSELQEDYDDDGILNQSNGTANGGTVDYSNNSAFAAGQGIVFTGATRDVFTTDSTGVVCFARGTMIETLSGQIAIEDLQAGDMVRTMDRGYRPLCWIGGRKLDIVDLTQHPALCPIRIAAGALGNGLPVKDLLVSPQHRVLVRSDVAKRMFDEQEVLVAANKLLTIDGIDIVTDTTEVEYFHMLFDQHEIVFSNGAATESLFTGPEAMRAVSAEARQEIASLFPALLEPEVALAPVRFIPAKGKLMKKLAQRHQSNGKPLYQA